MTMKAGPVASLRKSKETALRVELSASFPQVPTMRSKLALLASCPGVHSSSLRNSRRDRKPFRRWVQSLVRSRCSFLSVYLPAHERTSLKTVFAELAADIDDAEYAVTQD